MSLRMHYDAALAGQSVQFRPRGTSMVGLVADRALVRVEPCRPETLEPGDVVLVKVSGSIYLHKVTACDPAKQRVQIGNNRGRINGWAAWRAVAGIATTVDGVARPRTSGKTRPTTTPRVTDDKS